MTQLIGRTVNKNEIAVLSSGITLNTSTSVKISDAKVEGTPPSRTVMVISNPENHNIWIKFQPAATDNDKKGIWFPKSSTGNVIPPDNSYTGEISAIAVTGNPVIYLTEY